jgi:hypothetical protein
MSAIAYRHAEFPEFLACMTLAGSA